MQGRLRITFVGEGPNDIGRAPPHTAIDEDDEANGLAQALLRSVLHERGLEGASFDSVIRPIGRIIRFHGKPFRKRTKAGRNKVVRRLEAAVELATNLDRADGLVFIVDDSTEGAKHARALAEAVPGMRADAGIAVAAATAIQELEACFFADPDACDRAFQGFHPRSKRDPEDIRRPKEAFEEQFSSYQASTATREALAATADEAKYEIFPKISPEALKDRCRQGLGRLILQFEDELVPLFAGQHGKDPATTP